MNIYIVTEGKVDAAAYRHWIPLVNPRLTLVSYLADLNDDNFYLVSSQGYPGYFRTIEKAIEDVNRLKGFNRLVIAVDSEDMTRREKRSEISSYIASRPCRVPVKIVVQHFCFETWALGNRKIIRPNPSSRKLRSYKSFYNVRIRDPELLPDRPGDGFNRAQFAAVYLAAALKDKFKHLTYTKRNPSAILHDKYFLQVRRRFEETGHIRGFREFLDAFI